MTGAQSTQPVQEVADLESDSPVLPVSGAEAYPTGPAPFEVPREIDFAHVLGHLRPGAAWAIVGNRYDQIVWHDPSQTMPTLAECAAAWPQVALSQVNDHVRFLRQEALEREADPLFFKASAGECDRSVWLNKREEIRRRHPYYTLDHNPNGGEETPALPESGEAEVSDADRHAASTASATAPQAVLPAEAGDRSGETGSETGGETGLVADVVEAEGTVA